MSAVFFIICLCQVSVLSVRYVELDGPDGWITLGLPDVINSADNERLIDIQHEMEDIQSRISELQLRFNKLSKERDVILLKDLTGVDIMNLTLNRTTTYLPTKLPTYLPTKRPTLSPTSRPTQHPTARPTARPTKIPTLFPTDAWDSTPKKKKLASSSNTNKNVDELSEEQFCQQIKSCDNSKINIIVFGQNETDLMHQFQSDLIKRNKIDLIVGIFRLDEFTPFDPSLIWINGKILRLQTQTSDVSVALMQISGFVYQFDAGRWKHWITQSLHTLSTLGQTFFNRMNAKLGRLHMRYTNHSNNLPGYVLLNIMSSWDMNNVTHQIHVHNVIMSVDSVLFSHADARSAVIGFWGVAVRELLHLIHRKIQSLGWIDRIKSKYPQQVTWINTILHEQQLRLEIAFNAMFTTEGLAQLFSQNMSKVPEQECVQTFLMNAQLMAGLLHEINIGNIIHDWKHVQMLSHRDIFLIHQSHLGSFILLDHLLHMLGFEGTQVGMFHIRERRKMKHKTRRNGKWRKRAKDNNAVIGSLSLTYEVIAVSDMMTNAPKNLSFVEDVYENQSVPIPINI